MQATSTAATEPVIIVALDFDSAEPAVRLARQLDPALCRLKIGKELFTRAGPRLVDELQAAGFDIFLDLKFHDIPNTVAKAVAAAAALGVWMVNVHASGGRNMLTAAREAADKAAHKPLLTAVTVLTSMTQQDLADIGITRPLDQQVAALARLTRDCGLDGVVCSAREAQLLKQAMGERFILVTPGIRPAGAEAGDQRRVMTPAQALAAGSDYLVIGRPITQNPDPLAALRSIHAGIAGA